MASPDRRGHPRSHVVIRSTSFKNSVQVTYDGTRFMLSPGKRAGGRKAGPRSLIPGNLVTTTQIATRTCSAIMHLVECIAQHDTARTMIRHVLVDHMPSLNIFLVKLPAWRAAQWRGMSEYQRQMWSRVAQQLDATHLSLGALTPDK